MNNIFTDEILSDIQENTLESEITVLESMLITMENCEYITEHASDAEAVSGSFKLIMEGFVMEGDDGKNKKADGEGNVIQRFIKKISKLIGGIFKKNPGKAELSPKDKKKLAGEVKKVKNGGPINFFKRHKLLGAATIGATATGIRFAFVKHEANKIDKAGKQQMGSFADCLNEINVTESDGNISFKFTMDLKKFSTELDAAKTTFFKKVGEIMKLRADWTSGNASATLRNRNFETDFRKNYFTSVETAIRDIGKPFRSLYASYNSEGEVCTMTLDEWNTFVEKVSKDCVDVAENMDRLSDWMPSHNDNLTAKQDRLIDDMKKANPKKFGQDDAAYEAEIKNKVYSTYGVFKQDELKKYSIKDTSALNKLRQDMSDIHNNYIGMNKFFKRVGEMVNALKANPDKIPTENSDAVEDDAEDES